ncbi:hypothetical protein NP493_6721g00002 [Ridgeia piscesae]|uniref:Uncharacterized protein n=1 Tax=Ridgeia piscesae TaxID=27915 RepID=A0AAD9IR03_RIDPI|nr:hypothetical protein NP493_6721g00002 [Ridgeia piscesae]
MSLIDANNDTMLAGGRDSSSSIAYQTTSKRPSK